jgi:tetratricopeptide (TPR) repeat protein
MKPNEDIDGLLQLLTEIGLEPDRVELIRRHLVAGPEEENRWAGIAIELRQANRLHAADVTYDAALKRFPLSHRLWGNRGVLLRQWKRYDEAVKSLHQALQLKPDYTIAMESLGLVYEHQQDWRQAATWYEKALAISPGRALPLNNAANCYRALGDRRTARTCYEKALAADPNYADALFNYAALLYEDKHFDEAAAILDRFLAKHPSDQAALRLRAEIKSQPSMPKPLGHQQFDEPKLIVRPSVNYGWTGPIGQGRITGPVPMAPGMESNIVNLADVARMTREEAAAIVGYRTWDITQMWQLVQQEVARTNVPAFEERPILFLSYKRETPEHNAWVGRLAADLLARDYELVFDRFLEKDPRPPTVPELVSRLASCNLFVAILTEEYRRRVEPEDGAILLDKDSWVYDEWQVAAALTKAGRMKFCGVWKSGPVVPQPFTTKNVADFRYDAEYVASLDKAFPRLRFMVIGTRADSTGRMIGPLSRAEAEARVKQLSGTGEFVQVSMVRSND